MAVLHQRAGSPFWQASLRDPRQPDGITRRSTGERNKTAALRKAVLLQVELDAEIEAALEHAQTACGMTWLDAVMLFVEQGELKKSTRAGYAKAATVITEVLGDFDLGQLTHERIRDFCQKRRQMTVKPPGAADTGRKVSDQTIRNNLSLMSAVYKFVIDLDMPNAPSSNPFKTFERDFLRTSKKVDRHLRPVQFEEILAACKTARHRAMLITLVGSGLRSSELMELRWPEVDFKNNLIEFGNSDPDRSKTSRARRIPLLAPVSDALTAHRAAQLAAGEWEHDGLVFPGWTKDEMGRRVQRRRYDLKYLIKMVRSRTKVKGYFNHGLRHTFASWCRQQGLDADAIRRALGHSTTSTTDRYAHHIDDSMLEQFRRLQLPVTAQNTAQSSGFSDGEISPSEKGK